MIVGEGEMPKGFRGAIQAWLKTLQAVVWTTNDIA